MKDAYGRSIENLRISLTDKCNFRCPYCMPKEGIKHLEHGDILSFEEITRIVKVMCELGIKKVKLTGGEPMIRRGIADLISMLPCDVYMTTNASLLADNAVGLRQAGLRGVNISLDSLKSDRFLKMTGCDGLTDALAGIDAAIDAKLDVKLNSVLIRGINDDEAEDLTAFAGIKGVPIRFIELMPIGCASSYSGVPSHEILERLERVYGRSAPVSAPGSGPAEYYGFVGYPGKVGFISPMSHKFCEDCSRVRLTAEGFLKLCLQYPDGADLRALMRGGADDTELRHAIEDAVAKKPASHSFGEDGSLDTRKMVQIGG